MKKAKIFLTALAVLTVVGGALAFKAKQNNHFARVCDVEKLICTIDDFFTTETTIGGTEEVDYQSYGGPCDDNFECTTLVTTSL